MARVVVLGSSFGGITAAYELRKKLGPQHEVALISNSSRFVFRPSLPWVIFGLRTPHQVTADYTRGLAKRGIKYLQATVERVRPTDGEIDTTRGSIPYDYLVIALGAHIERDAVPGLDRHTECVLWLDDALRVRERLERFDGGDITLLEVQGSPLACPSYEVALGLHHYFKRRGIRDRVRIRFVSHLDTPFEPAGTKASGVVADELRRAGIQWLGSRQTRRVGNGSVTVNDGEHVPADLFIAFPPYRGTDALVRSKGLTDEHGFVETHRTMRSVHFPNVFAAGDSVGFPGPKSGRMAELQAHIAAHNIARRIGGGGPVKEYKTHLVCIMELWGRRGLFAYRKESPTQGPTTFSLAFPGMIPHYAKAAWEKYYMATRF